MALSRTAEQSVRANKATSTALSAAGTAAGAVTGIFAAAAGLNAVPVAGQIVGAALALAGLLTKIFIGRKQKKKREAQERRDKEDSRQQRSFDEGRQVGGDKGNVATQGGNELIGKTAPVNEPNAPSYGNWGVDRLATPQDNPSQAALNSSLGLGK
jgi:hypothetical protein